MWTPVDTKFFFKYLKAYIGHKGAADCFISPSFLSLFFYKLLHEGCSEREAWEHAASYDERSRGYVMYDEKVCHSIN